MILEAVQEQLSVVEWERDKWGMTPMQLCESMGRDTIYYYGIWFIRKKDYTQIVVKINIDLQIIPSKFSTTELQKKKSYHFKPLIALAM